MQDSIKYSKMHEQIIGALELVAKDCEKKPQKNMLIDYIEIQFAIKFAL